MLKVYADTGSLDQSRFPDAFPLLMPLLAPQWMNDPAKKANPVWLNQIDITPNPADADAFALVLERQDYFLPNYAAVYQQMADTAIHHKKPLYYFSGGDFGVAPKYAHEIAVRVCAYRPEHESNTVIMPTFFLDPVITILKQEWKPLQ